MNKGIFYYNIRGVKDGYNNDYDTVFPLLKAHGIDGFQFGDTELRGEGSEELIAAVERHGMKTYVIHKAARLFTSDKEILGKSLKAVRDTYPLVKRMGCKYLMVVPTVEEGDIESPEDTPRAVAQLIDILNTLVPEGEAEGITVVLENIGNAKYPYVSLEQIKTILDGCPTLAYGFDTGNYIRGNTDINEAYKVLKDRISVIHLKNRAEDFTDAPFDGGVIGLPEFMTSVKRDGIRVPTVLEYCFAVSYEDIFHDSAVTDSLLS